MAGMNNNQPRERDNPQGDGYIDIPCPARHDALGHALRSSFTATPENAALPEDMLDLLDMLNNRTRR